MFTLSVYELRQADRRFFNLLKKRFSWVEVNGHFCRRVDLLIICFIV